MIIFEPLNELHFSLLLKWLEMPHVKAFWDKDIKWSMNLIRKKYKTYVKGYKILEYENKLISYQIHAYIIKYENNSIGYIQYYNKHDFLLSDEYIFTIPKNCAGIDFYIGEQEYTGSGIGTKLLKQFLNEYILPKYEYVFVDTEIHNIAAIKTYIKCGFRLLNQFDKRVIYILKK